MKKSIVFSIFFSVFLTSLPLAAALVSPEAIVEEIAPTISVISYDVAAYQKGLVRKGKIFEMSPWTNIRIEYEGADPYGVKVEPLKVDEGTPQERSFIVKETNISSISFIPGTSIPQLIVVDFTFPEKLAEGKHNISLYARSLGKFGKAARATENITVNIIGGPIRILAFPLTYPSPFSIKRDKVVTVQYRLSEDADIDVYLIGVGGRRVKKLSFSAGEKGGRMGLNKIIWDGAIDAGGAAGNGIYSGTIVDRNNEKLIGKFKLTIVN